jgi:thiamine-monophosphate kinase
LKSVIDEFSLINQFFKSLISKRDDVLIGIGDDAACIRFPQGKNLIVSTDTLISGVHFLAGWDAYDIAYKSVMVNISDMAAMAAEPCWLTLAITLPEFNQEWLTSFGCGLNDALNQYNLALIGGDTTCGALSITITVIGTAEAGKAISRSGANPGDIIVVSGELGAAALAVQLLEKPHLEQQDKTELMNKLIHPQARIDLTHFLRSYASAAIDISDGLSADLNHICTSSGVGACLHEEAIPIHPLLYKYLNHKAVDLALSGGDDYELCFTVPEHHFTLFINEINKANLHCYPIGVIEENPGLRIKNVHQHSYELEPKGYSHF